MFPTSIMVLFEIHQRFKGHFLNELLVSFPLSKCYYPKCKDEQKFYLTSFKIVADFLNS